ncbi:MAG: 2-vinyl bacteriochlorophyllide hydratase, partial [Pseudomonadota bacterium]
SIWEKVVFGKYLFADAFFWEDVFSMLVLALHTAYLYALFFTAMSQSGLLMLALAAYGAYVINAAQFLLKLRQARLQAQRFPMGFVQKNEQSPFIRPQDQADFAVKRASA